jgi:hypothetical protein
MNNVLCTIVLIPIQSRSERFISVTRYNGRVYHCDCTYEKVSGALIFSSIQYRND